MKPKKRQKLCQNCEADVDLDVIVCPYCAADLREEKPEQADSYVQQPLFRPEKTADSLYPPPYSNPEEELGEEIATEEKEEPKSQSIILPTVFITFGAQLFLLGLLILLFSQNGVLLLRWDAKFWIFYVLASFPFLFLGYKSLAKLK